MGDSTDVSAGLGEVPAGQGTTKPAASMLAQHRDLILFAVSLVVAALALSGTLLSYPLCKHCGAFLGAFWTLTSVSLIILVITGLNYVSAVHGRVLVWQTRVAQPVGKAIAARSAARWSMRACAVLVVLVSLVNIVLFSVFANLAATTPSIKDGIVTAPGLSAPVRIDRDDAGTLHIHAEARHDVFFAQGFAVAQERLWQLEFNRRAGFGRLSELFGSATLEADQFLRDIGFGRAAVGGLAWMEPEVASAIQSYADGINAYVASDAYRTPIEFRLFGINWETWKPEHSIVVTKLMSFDLSRNVKAEAIRWNLLMKDGLPADEIYRMYGEYGEDIGTVLQRVDEPWNDTFTTAPASHPHQKPAPSPARAAPDWQGYMQLAEELARDNAQDWQGKGEAGLRFNPLAGLGLGGAGPNDAHHSNNWVISGTHTDTGKPYLLNDPHLGASAPLIWNMGHLSCPQFEAQGVMLMGLPWVVIGTNAHVAWGITNNLFDYQDLFIMQPGATAGTYVHNNTEHAYTELVEEIIVSGEESPVQHVVRHSLYGPVMTKWYSNVDNGPELSLKWLTVAAPDHYDSTLGVFYRLNEQVRDFSDFRNAASYWSNTAGQSLVYADLTGDIGFTAPGSVPVRRHHDGAFPVPGNGTYDWLDFIPYREMPAAYNPTDGFVATANNRMHPLNTTAPFPHLITDMDFAAGMRYQAIRDGLLELIDATASNVTASQMLRLQHDRQEYLWRLGLRDAVARMSSLPGDWRARMLAWNGQMSVESVEATVYGELFIRITRDLVAPGLPDIGVWDHVSFLRPLFNDSAASPAHSACTERGFASCHAFLEDRAKLAVANVQTNATLPWGEAMYTHFRHAILGFTPFGCMFNRHVGRGGGPTSINVAFLAEAHPGMPGVYQNTHIPSMRMLLNLADLRNGNMWIMPMGVSGNPYDKYYDNLTDMWATDQLVPMQMDDYPVAHSLVLEP